MKGEYIGTVSKVISITCLFFVITVQSNFLDATTFSRLLFITTFVSVLGFLDLGFGSHLLLKTPRERVFDSDLLDSNSMVYDISRVYLKASLLATFGLSLIFLLVLAFDGQDLSPVFLLFFFFLVLTYAVSNIISKIGISSGLIVENVTIQGFSAFSQLISTIFIGIISPTLESFLVSYGIGYSLSIVLGFCYLRKRHPLMKIRISLDASKVQWGVLQSIQVIQLLTIAGFQILIFRSLHYDIYNQFQILSRIFLSLSSIFSSIKSFKYLQASKSNSLAPFRMSKGLNVLNLTINVIIAVCITSIWNIVLPNLASPSWITLLVWINISFFNTISQFIYYHIFGQHKFRLILKANIIQGFTLLIPFLFLNLPNLFVISGVFLCSLIFQLSTLLLSAGIRK